MKLPHRPKRRFDLEGRLIKDGVRKAIRDRQNALHELLNAINQVPEGFGEQAVDAPGFGLRARSLGVEQGD